MMWQKPYALLDLVEAKTPGLQRDFLRKAAKLAKEVGGRLVLANKVLPPLFVPDERAIEADRATDSLVITWYPTTEAGEAAFSARKEWADQFIYRTYASQPIMPFVLKINNAVLFTLGLFNRAARSRYEGQEQIQSLIATADIVQGVGIFEGNWTEQLELSNNQPIWMLNFLEYTEEANFAADVEYASTEPISGAKAYAEYGDRMATSLASVGGRIVWRSTAPKQLSGIDDGRWHEIAIATYPSAKALLTMYARPAYRAAHVYRNAGLARTRLVATQPITEE
tara:strand:+ start:1967 stop:2812 length:846 start_codon:yes stop_codon:yes gene_type:complete